MLLKRLSKIGSGCGIEVRGDDLYCVAVKSRPAGLVVLGVRVIADFRDRPPSEWGREYADFLAQAGLSHVAATLGLPREEVVARSLRLPPSSEKERAAAIRFQLDGLHPFGDDEIRFSHAAVGGEGKSKPTTTVVWIAEKERVDFYADLLEQAGVALAAVTVPSAALYASLRLRWDDPPKPLLVVERRGETLQIYGESEGRPLLSAEFGARSISTARAVELALAELRADSDEPATLVAAGEPGDDEGLAWTSPEEIFPTPLEAPADFDLRLDLAALATAIESACPRLGLRANLLPEARRKTDSRKLWAPTAALALLLVLLAAGFLARPWIQDKTYAAALEERIAAFERAAALSDEAEGEAAELRLKRRVLESAAARAPNALKLLSEVSTRLPDTAWLTRFELSGDAVRLDGEAASAAPLLETLNAGEALAEASFATSLSRTEEGERFQISARVEAAPAVPAPPEGGR